MEELLASQTQTRINIRRDQQVTGAVVNITSKEITLDIGAKAEGVLGAKEFSEDKIKSLKPGDEVKAFVIYTENDSGQVVLSLFPRQEKHTFKGKGHINFNRFHAAKSQNSRIRGLITEINKGGFIVEAGGVRGFLPNSQIGFELLSNLSSRNPDLIGVEGTFYVSEIDEENNRLIFTQKDIATEEEIALLKKFKKDDKISGKIVAILPFALVVELESINGLVFISDVSWDRMEDLSVIFKTGQSVECLITNIDTYFARLNLSIKQLTEDPFTALTKDFPADDVVKGEIVSQTAEGVLINLKAGMQGFLPLSKQDPDTNYEAGNNMTFLVDGIDFHKRRVNLTPFITSMAGLIYK